MKQKINTHLCGVQNESVWDESSLLYAVRNIRGIFEIYEITGSEPDLLTDKKLPIEISAIDFSNKKQITSLLYQLNIGVMIGYIRQFSQKENIIPLL